jgi:hypothetical protein
MHPPTGGHDTNDDAEKVVVMRMMVPGTNKRSRRSWRTTGGNVEKAVESGYHGN